MLPSQLFPIQIYPDQIFGNITESQPIESELFPLLPNQIFASQLFAGYLVSVIFNENLSDILNIKDWASNESAVDNDVGVFSYELFPDKIFSHHIFARADLNVTSLEIFDTVNFKETFQYVKDNVLLNYSITIIDSIQFIEALQCSFDGNYFVQITDFVNITESLQYATLNSVNNVSINDILNLADNLTYFSDLHTSYSLVINDTLALIEHFVSFKPTYHVVDITDTLILRDSFHQTLGFYHYYLQDYIRLIENVNLTLPPSVGVSLTDTLVFVETLNKQVILSVHLNDELVLNENGYTKYVEGITINVPGLIATKVPNPNPNPVYNGMALGLQSGFIRPSLPYVTLQGLTDVVLLPAPLFGDVQSNVGTVNINRAISGKMYTFIKKTVRNRLKWKFSLRRQKAYELNLYIQKNNLDFMYVTDWKGNMWYMKIVNNPVIFEAISRDSPICVQSNEYHEVELEFEGYLINGQLPSLSPISTPISTAGQANYATAILGVTSLISYWKMDQTSGNTIIDSKGGNTGSSISSIVSNPTTNLTGLGGPYIVFNGSSSYFTASNSLDFSQGAVELWFNPVGLGTQTLISTQSSTSEIGFGITIIDGVLNIFTGKATYPVDGSINAGSFNYLVVNISGAIGTQGVNTEAYLNVYLNGTYILYNTIIIPNLLSAVPLYIGTDQPNNTPFAGGMMHLAIYGTPLNSAQVASHYSLGQ
jgi:hypothetical protein